MNGARGDKAIDMGLSRLTVALAPAVWAQEKARVQTPARTMDETVRVSTGLPSRWIRPRDKGDGRPIHAVYPTEYCIDRFEVSNTQCARFLIVFGRNTNDLGIYFVMPIPKSAPQPKDTHYCPASQGTRSSRICSTAFVPIISGRRDVVVDRGDVGEDSARY